MGQRREKTVNAEVLAQWRGRLGVLRQRLVEMPGAEDAWFWRIQFHLIWFLLARYDPESLRGLEGGAAGALPVESVKMAGPAMLGVTPVGALRASGAGKGPRASKEIGPALARISDSNRERYEEAKKEREELAAAIWRQRRLTLEARTKHPATLEWVEWMNAKNEMERLIAVEKMIAMESPPTMTDEQIREILLNPGIELGEDDRPATP